MVTIVDYKRSENSEGEEFFMLKVHGGIEMVQSQTTGRFYATARSSSIPSTFDESTCQRLIGTNFPGNIRRVQCDPYEYTIEETGEVIELDFRYEYVPENRPKLERRRRLIQPEGPPLVIQAA
jgi:hypothetical protein